MRQAKLAIQFVEQFDQVAQESRWNSHAKRIMRSWPQPAYVSEEDVRQDLLLGAWLKGPTFDPARRTVSFDEYMVWHAFDKAKKRAHKARGAYRHRGADRSPGRYEKPFSSFGRAGEAEEGTESRLSVDLQVEPEQGVRLEREQSFELAQRLCVDDRERAVLDAIGKSDGTLESAASCLYDDVERRLELRLASQESAGVLVRRVVREIVCRMQRHEEGEDA